MKHIKVYQKELCFNETSFALKLVISEDMIRYVTLDHKTRHKRQFLEIEINNT